MKKILIICFSLFFITPLFSQKRDITLDDLWKNYTFYPKSYSGLNSMNDGEHYVTMEKTEDGQEIIKYRFKSGKKVRTLFKSNNFEIPKVGRYTFSQDEKQLLLATKIGRAHV
jgi:dipeptidyl-peptidase-4